MAQITIWNDGASTVVKAPDAAVDTVREALTRALGGSEQALEFVARSGVDVLLAAHFADASQSFHAYERFDRRATPKATQALGTAAAYFEAGHSGNAVFLHGLEPVQLDDSDEICHRYYALGKRLLPQVHNAFNACWVQHD